MFVEMKGRLGNQFFIYAFARKIAEKNNDYNLVFDFSFVDNKNKELKEENWEDNLKYFNVKPYKSIICKKRALINCSTFQQKIYIYTYLMIKKIFMHSSEQVHEFEQKWQYLLNKKGVFLTESRYVNINENLNKNIGNTVISGHYESSKYFDDIRDILMEEFTPKYPPLEKNRKMYEQIEKTESVCVTIRRGDFISVPEYKKEFFLCDYDYFKKGMDYIANKIPNCKFFIFSDDVEWIKENYDFGYDVIYESGNDPIWEKIRMMYSCKHFIISNSTFSWWAQYLSRNKSKIVVSPNRWFNGDKKSDLIEESFYKIEV